MSGYLGSRAIDEVLTFTAVTTKFDTGVATDADSAPTYRVYEDETGTPLLTGSMALLDSANTAGLYSEAITLSAANGFEKGKSYSIAIAATVNSVTGACSRHFQIEAAVNVKSVGGTAQTAGDLAAIATAAERNIRQTIESQRGHHTACGSIFYVKKGGNDANPGTYALPFLTVQAALNACTANAHDMVVVLGAAGSDPSVFTEALTMSKAYVFLRGMGRDVKITTAGAASSTIAVSAKGCEVTGLWINNTGTGATKGIEFASGADFGWVHHCFVDGSAKGVEMNSATNVTVENNRINDCATAGVDVTQTGAPAGLHNRILNNHIDGSAIGINFAGSDSSESIARYNNISGCTTGVVIAAGALKVQVTDNRFAGNTTNYTDAGTDSNISWNQLGTTSTGAVSNVATVNALANNSITAAALATDAVTEMQSGLATSAEVGALLSTNYYDIAVAAQNNEIAAIKGKTDTLPANPADVSNCIDAAGVRAAIGLALANLDAQLDALPTAAENQSGMATAAALATVASYIDTEVASIIATLATLSTLDAAGVRAALGMSTANLDTQLADLPTNAELTAALAAADDAILALVTLVKARTDLIPNSPAAVGDAMTLTSAYDYAKGTVAMAESYRADGASPTPVQAMCELLAHAGESSVAGFEKTIKKFDGVTTAAVFTLDDDVAPTSITRAS